MSSNLQMLKQEFFFKFVNANFEMEFDDMLLFNVGNRNAMGPEVYILTWISQRVFIRLP